MSFLQPCSFLPALDEQKKKLTFGSSPLDSRPQAEILLPKREQSRGSTDTPSEDPKQRERARERDAEEKKEK